MAAKISIRNLAKHFVARGGQHVALDGISLDIAPGEFFTIVGPSGCGKTTLLRILAGLETPTAGGFDAERGDSNRPFNSMVFQGDSIFPWMTVWDNAAYGLRTRGVPRAQVNETVRYFLDRTGLAKFAHCYPYQLSGGMRQRVAIVRAFANDPEVLLMDEPFSALDAQNRVLLQEEVLRIWDQTKKTVVFITHSVDEAVTLGDRVLVMTAHPGRAKVLVDVPFARPRDVLALRARPEYGELVFRIWGYLKEEVQSARKQEQEQPA